MTTTESGTTGRADLIAGLRMAAAWLRNIGTEETAQILDRAILALSSQPAQPVQQEPPKFPTMLRKMWSGGEVQDWIDRNWPSPLTRNAVDEVIREASAYVTKQQNQFQEKLTAHPQPPNPTLSKTEMVGELTDAQIWEIFTSTDGCYNCARAVIAADRALRSPEPPNSAVGDYEKLRDEVIEACIFLMENEGKTHSAMLLRTLKPDATKAGAALDKQIAGK